MSELRAKVTIRLTHPYDYIVPIGDAGFRRATIEPIAFSGKTPDLPYRHTETRAAIIERGIIECRHALAQTLVGHGHPQEAVEAAFKLYGKTEVVEP